MCEAPASAISPTLLSLHKAVVPVCFLGCMLWQGMSIVSGKASSRNRQVRHGCVSSLKLGRGLAAVLHREGQRNGRRQIWGLDMLLMATHTQNNTGQYDWSRHAQACNSWSLQGLSCSRDSHLRCAPGQCFSCVSWARHDQGWDANGSIYAYLTDSDAAREGCVALTC